MALHEKKDRLADKHVSELTEKQRKDRIERLEEQRDDVVRRIETEGPQVPSRRFS